MKRDKDKLLKLKELQNQSKKLKKLKLTIIRGSGRLKISISSELTLKNKKQVSHQQGNSMIQIQNNMKNRLKS